MSVVEALDALFRREAHGVKHLPEHWCGAGFWYAAHGAPDGQPCSERCTVLRRHLEALKVAEREKAIELTQPELWGVAA